MRHPKYAGHNSAVITVGAAGPGFLRWQDRGYTRPLLISQLEIAAGEHLDNWDTGRDRVLVCPPHGVAALGNALVTTSKSGPRQTEAEALVWLSEGEQ